MEKAMILNVMRQDLVQVAGRFHYLALANIRSRVGNAATRAARRLEVMVRAASTGKIQPLAIYIEVLVTWARLEEMTEMMPKMRPRQPLWATAEAIENLRGSCLEMLIKWGQEIPEIRTVLPQEIKLIIYEEEDALEWQRRDQTRALEGEVIDVETNENEG